MPTKVEFSEKMKGLATLGESDYELGMENGRPLEVDLKIRTEDIDFFLNDPEHRGAVEGTVRYEALGDKAFPIEKGEFDCLVEGPGESREIHYRLFFYDENGIPYTLTGVKFIRHDGFENIWRDCSTLYTNIFEGHIDRRQEKEAKPSAAGVIHVGLGYFIFHELATFRGEGGSPSQELDAVAKFGRFFFGELWDVYKPKLELLRSNVDEGPIPWFTLSGVDRAEISTHYLHTGDGLGLQMFRFTRAPCQDVVVLLHGLTTSTDMFIMPEHYNIVNYLHDHGFTDVWSFDWRGSMRYDYDLVPGPFTMDDIALYDMPAAFTKIRSIVGANARIHVICHCVGSLTFMMSLYAKRVTGIPSVISNSLSLNPRVARWCRWKLRIAPLVFFRAPNLEPRWAVRPGLFPYGKMFGRLVSLWHPECDVAACHMVSFMWGSGRPAAWMHENLSEITHRRTGRLFGAVNIRYYRHIRKMVSKGVAVKMDPNDSRYDLLPNDYLQHAGEIDTPVLFVTGDQNRIFLDSNVVTYHTLKKLKSTDRNELKVFSGYGHQDPFMGKDSARDIFPVFLEFLERHREKHSFAAGR